ncbi:hypothetical protein THRCLA_08849 [Thraustotheca clavata]|uniref:Homeobox and zinc-finger domain-containing protein n=1 Tax=Thraustotheca clavata TaxID=74557 RepID=A0A1V9Z1K3_9STRA|nr:hypothetical protein THRCLA_08849 [Thraustotheca clavata]
MSSDEEARRLLSDTPEKTTICEICHEDTAQAKRALICAQCAVRFHTTCFRQKYAKLITTNHAKKWFCPDCEPIKKNVPQPKLTKKKERKNKSGALTPTKGVNSENKYARLMDVSLRAGKKFNAMVIEKSEDMLHLTQNLKNELEAHFGGQEDEIVDDDAAPSVVLLRKVLSAMSTLESSLYTLQYQSIQNEVDFIKDIKFPSDPETKNVEKEAKDAAKAKLKVKTGGGASRLYTSAQIQKLEEWYSKSSRPESSEIQAMYRIINAPQYADTDLQPEGIAVKQIRIWFDNRRAKERLDYMRMKMKEEDTSNMDSEEIKKLKASYIDEAKEVLEARVAKMRETSAGAMEIVEEAEKVALEPTSTIGDSSVDASPIIETKKKAAPPAQKSKQRLRMDHVASVRKACRLAKEQGLRQFIDEEETKEIRAKAMQAARERLFYNGKAVGSHPLTKEEVTDFKFKLLKLVEEDAPAESCMDIIELLLSVDIPAQVLVDTRLDRQLKLVAKSHQDNKELVKLATRLSDNIQSIILAVDEQGPMPIVEEKPSAAGDAPKIVRAKFSVDQLRLLEKAFLINEAPDKDQLLKLRARMNKVSGDSSSDYKQLRCWFYKRKAAGHPPSTLVDALASGEVKSLDEEDSEGDESFMEKIVTATPQTAPTAARKTKSQGRIFSEKQLQVLHATYEANSRPDASVFDTLQEKMNVLSEDDTNVITKRQLKNWFSNRRAKDQKGKAVIDDEEHVKEEVGMTAPATDLSRVLLNPDEESHNNVEMDQDSDDEHLVKPSAQKELFEQDSPSKRKLDMPSSFLPQKKPKQA